ncbi:MAG: PQQ-binding-like beta-propeller repeat protein [Anaerolineales bacterium]|jgi:outer membrane protein assembly factor BamB
MKNKHILLIISLLVLSVLLSACGTRVLPSSWPGITAVGDTVYVAYNNSVYALELDDGDDIWTFPDEADRSQTFFASPVLTKDGQVLIGTYNNLFYSIDAETGRENWMTDEVSNYWIASPLATQDGIYAPNADHTLYSLDENGNPTPLYTAEDALWAAPITDGETIYLAGMDHNVYALPANGKSPKWIRPVNGAMVSPPAISPEGALFVGTFGSEVVAIDSQRGEILWENPTNNWVWAGPAYYDGLVVAADMDGMVYAFDAGSGDTLWVFDTDSPIIGSPLIHDGTIYIATESGKVFTLDTDGKRGWTETIGGRLLSSPVAAGDLILFGVVDGESGEVIVALDANGNQQWVFAP